MSSEAPNWAFTEDQAVKCPTCGHTCTALDWVLDDAGEQLTGARVFPCNDVIPIPPYQFGPTGTTGTLKFTKLGDQ